MNLANKLTLSRIGMSFLFMALLLSNLPLGKTLALAIFTLAAVTDAYDGRLARKRGMVTSFGKLMDPLADKILISSAFISFVQLSETHVRAWMVVAIISREFAVTGVRLLAAARGEVLAAGKWGKHKTFSQMVAIFVILGFLSFKDVTNTFGLAPKVGNMFDDYFTGFVYALMLVTVFLTLFSGYLYVRDNRNLFVEATTERGGVAGDGDRLGKNRKR